MHCLLCFSSARVCSCKSPFSRFFSSSDFCMTLLRHPFYRSLTWLFLQQIQNADLMEAFGFRTEVAVEDCLSLLQHWGSSRQAFEARCEVDAVLYCSSDCEFV